MQDTFQLTKLIAHTWPL
jgi:hypothetical protein